MSLLSICSCKALTFFLKDSASTYLPAFSHYFWLIINCSLHQGYTYMSSHISSDSGELWLTVDFSKLAPFLAVVGRLCFEFFSIFDLYLFIHPWIIKKSNKWVHPDRKNISLSWPSQWKTLYSWHFSLLSDRRDWFWVPQWVETVSPSQHSCS